MLKPCPVCGRHTEKLDETPELKCLCTHKTGSAGTVLYMSMKKQQSDHRNHSTLLLGKKKNVRPDK